jgi:hypothetical protein
MARIGGDPRGGEPKNAAEVVELVKRTATRIESRG